MVLFFDRNKKEFYKNTNPHPEDVKTVLANLLNVLKEQKKSINSTQEQDKEEISSFVIEQFMLVDSKIVNGLGETSTIKEALNVAYLIDVLEVFESHLGEESVKRSNFSKSLFNFQFFF